MGAPLTCPQSGPSPSDSCPRPDLPGCASGRAPSRFPLKGRPIPLPLQHPPGGIPKTCFLKSSVNTGHSWKGMRRRSSQTRLTSLLRIPLIESPRPTLAPFSRRNWCRSLVPRPTAARIVRRSRSKSNSFRPPGRSRRRAQQFTQGIDFHELSLASIQRRHVGIGHVWCVISVPVVGGRIGG